MAKKINPWAVCHSQLGKKKTDKFERCVMKIKSKHGIKDWTEFKAALRYLSETVQGQEDDIRVARERQEKEKETRKAAARRSQPPRKPTPIRFARSTADDAAGFEVGESVSFKEKLKYMKEAIKSATSTGLVRGRIGKRPKGGEEEGEMRRQKGILAHTESEGPSLREKIKYMKEQYNPEHLKGKAGQVKTPDPDMPALKKAMQRFHRADRAARGVNPQPHGDPKLKRETPAGYKRRAEKESGEAVRSGELQRRGNWPGKVKQVGRKDDGTESEGPSLKEKLTALSREAEPGVRGALSRETEPGIRGAPKEAQPRGGRVRKGPKSDPGLESGDRPGRGGARRSVRRGGSPGSQWVSSETRKAGGGIPTRRGGTVRVGKTKRERAVSHTEYEGPSLAETKDWIQGAVNPKHKGYCTPMTKKTCTPARKALAKRFKKAGRQEGTKKGGKTGWKGKV